MKKALTAATLIAAVTFGGTATADHQPVDQRIPGLCYRFSGGGWLGAACPPGERPYIGAVEFYGPDRRATATEMANAYLSGAIQPGALVIARFEDESASIIADLVGGTYIRVPGGNDRLPVDVAEAIAANHTAPQFVIVGGPAAIGDVQRVDAAWAYTYGEARG